MSLLVTGSIGIDTVKTPFGISENCLGGSAIYFSMAASFFAPVRFTGVVGNDCPFDLAKTFAGRDVDLAGLEVRKESKTFRWSGSYKGAMNEATTEAVELNVLAEQPPKVPAAYKDSQFVFLANTAPALQQQVLEQIDEPVFTAVDTMNYWIENNLNDLKALLAKIDCLIINEDEARMLANEANLICAADAILDMGVEVIVIKKGESGSIVSAVSGERFALPAWPSVEVKDPTGAGDCFAGAMLGYLASVNQADFESLKTAVAYGTVAASFSIADFSLKGIGSASREMLDARLQELKKLTQF